MKKLLSIFLVIAMIFTLAPMNIFAEDAANPVFSDMKDTDYYANAAKALEQLGILSGYPDGTFGAEKPITRAEMAAVVCRMINMEADAQNAKGETSFDDVIGTHWASGYINVASQKSIINGDGNGKFRPEDNVLYEEAIKMVVCALGYGDGIVAEPEDWSKGYLKVAEEKKISDNLKGAKGSAATRGDIAVMSYNGVASQGEKAKVPATPVASKEAGEYTGTQKVKLTTTTDGAEIYYTTDGSAPTVKSTKYTKDITVAKTLTLKAIAVKDGILSNVLSVDYTIKIAPSGGGGGGGGGGSTATKKYTVSFNLNYEGATGAPESQSVVKGKYATVPTAPEREGYVFGGWYKDAECTVSFKFTTKITSDLTLYAKWNEPITMSVVLDASAEELFVSDTNESVTFYATVSDTTESSLTIKLYDENSNYVSDMYDDGQYTDNGDELSNDNIYSCRVNLDTSVEKQYSYKAVIEEDYVNVTSDVYVISVVASITPQQIENMATVDDAIENNILLNDDYSDLSAEEKADFAQEQLETLEDQGLIAENSIMVNEDNSAISFQYESGVLGSVVLREWDEEQNGLLTERTSLQENAIALYSQDLEYSVNTFSNETVEESDIDALILWSFGQETDNESFRIPFYQDVEVSWENMGVDADVNFDTTVEDYKYLDDYEIVVFAGHGLFTVHVPNKFEGTYLKAPSLVLHERANSAKDEEYANDLKTLKISKLTLCGKGKSVYTVYAILPGFWEKYYGNDGLDGKFFFGENCEFYGKNENKDYSMSEALLDCSAEAVIGFHNSVMANYSRNLMDEYVRFLIEGKTAGEAFESAKEIHGDNDYFIGRELFYGPTAYPIFQGDKKAALSDTNFDNGSFEEGVSQGGWKKEGDVRAISKLGEFIPKDGTKMAILTTGIGSGESSYGEATEGSVLYQTFKVPSDAETLKFVYNVVSEEPMEFVGSQFDDKFKAEINCDGETYEFVYESINGSIWYTASGVDFDGGDVTTYQTGWKSVNFDISDYQNKTITLRFVVYDVGDSVYDTAALIDNVVIQ